MTPRFAPDPGVQKDEVDKLCEKYENNLHEHDRWFAISHEWWNAWGRYVKGLGPNPEIIDNSDIVDDSGQSLKDDGVNEGSEYELRHEHVWNLLSKWYGATHEVSGKVCKNSKGELYVEIFPMRFHVLTVGPESGEPKYMAEEQLLIVPRSTIFEDLEEKVKTFLVNHADYEIPDSSHTRFWICPASADKFKLVKDEVMNEELKDVLPGLGKWKLLYEIRDKNSHAWLCGDGATDVDENKHYSTTNNSSSIHGTSNPPVNLRGRAVSFVRNEPMPGQRVDAKRQKDDRWLEAVVVEVRMAPPTSGPLKHVVRVHFISFDSAEDEDFDVSNTERLASPYTRVPDWRTQLRKDEEIEVNRSVVASSLVAAKGQWLSGKVKQFNRSNHSPNGSSEGGSGTDEMDTDDTENGEDNAKPKRKRRNFVDKIRNGASNALSSPGRLSLTRSSATPPPGTSNGRGMVLVEVRTGTLFTQRKEVWLDLDSEDIAQRYTHTVKPKATFGPQSVQERPEESGVVGLRNLGNTCFMNSMLQCLSFSVPLTDYFLRGEYENDLNRKNPLGTGGKLAEAYAALINDIWSDRYKVVVPTEFKQELGRAFTQFQGYQQQDSHEMLSLLADGLHEDLNRVRKKPYTETVESNGRPDEEVAQESWDAFKLRNDSIIVDEFMGLLRSHLTCPQCDNETIKFDPYSNWSVPIPKATQRQIQIVLYSMGGTTSGNVPQAPKLMRFVASVPVNGTQADVAQWLAEKTGITPSELLLVELYNNKKASGGFLHDPNNPYDSESKYPTPYNADLRHWDDSKDVIAYELSILHDDGVHVQDPASPPDASRSAAQAKTGGGRTKDVSSAKREAAAAAALARRALPPKGRIVELRFLPPDSTYQSFRMSDFFQVEGIITARQMLKFIWERCQFMFRDDAMPPAAFSAAFSPDPAERPNEDELLSQHDKPYEVYNSIAANVPVENTDTRWNPTETIIVKFTRAGMGSLQFPPPQRVSYSYRHNESWEDRERDYASGPIELDATAENLRKASGSADATTSGVDIYECFNRFREREQLGENDEWYCPKCKELVKAYKQMEIWSCPEILVIHLKRFYYERSRYVTSWIDREKITDLVTFPMDNLDLREYVCGHKDGDPQPIYDLYAVSNHMGGMGGGHYTAYIKQPDTKSWHLMDDSRTSVAKPEDVVSEYAYVLFYRRRAMA